MRRACASGMLGASGVMFLRIAVLLAVISPRSMFTLGGASGLAGLVLLVGALWQWRQLPGESDPGQAGQSVAPMSPFNLGTALAFGSYLAVIAVLVPAAKVWLGARGIYMLSAVSGVADVDAIVISLAHMHHAQGIATVAAGMAVGLATLSNIATKVVLAWSTAGGRVGLMVATGNLLALGVGALTLWGFLLPASLGVGSS